MSIDGRDVQMEPERSSSPRQSRGRPREVADGHSNQNCASNGVSDRPDKKRDDDRDRRDRRGRRDDYSNELGTTLYVTNVPLESRSEDLKSYFEKFGSIDESRVINNPVTKESRGFAFLRYREAKDAEEAMKAMDGKEFEGKILRVEIAKRSRPHDPTPGQYKGPTGRKGFTGRRDFDGGSGGKYEQRGRGKSGYTPVSYPQSSRTFNDDRIYSSRGGRGGDSQQYESRYDRGGENRYDDRGEPRGYHVERGGSDRDRPSGRQYADPYGSEPHYDDYHRRTKAGYPVAYEDTRKRSDPQWRPRSRSRDRRERTRRSLSPRRYGDRPRSPLDSRRR